MKALAKIAVVVAGYFLAGLLACGVVALHEMMVAEDSQGSDGMYAFGDILFFIAAFAFFSLVPTGAAVYFMATRKSPRA